MAVEPTGEEHVADDVDIFFSTTDRRGHIQEANEVFTRLARYPYEALQGRPHNIIRHPSMPAGTYRLMWDSLLNDGAPFCAYVRNLAGDGSAYWTFATVTTVGDELLSVRCRPMRTDLRDSADAIYRSVRPRELDARATGTNANDAATLGAEAILRELAGAGFASYQAFQRSALPAEMAARHAVVPTLPAPVTGATSPAGRIVSLAREIGVTLRSLASRLADNREGAAGLEQHLTRATSDLAGLREAFAVQEGDGAGRKLLERATASLVSQGATLSDRLRDVAESARAAVEQDSELAFSVALSELQAETVGRFALATAEDREPAERARVALSRLVSSLETQLYAVHHALESNREAEQRYAKAVEAASGGLELTRRLLASWEGLAGTVGVAPSPRLPALLTQMDTDIGAIRDDAERGAGVTIGFDWEVVKRSLDDMLVVARELG